MARRTGIVVALAGMLAAAMLTPPAAPAQTAAQNLKPKAIEVAQQPPQTAPQAAPQATPVPVPTTTTETAILPGAPQPGSPPGAATILVPGSEFRYDPVGRRDPFKSLLQLETKKRDVSQLPPIQQLDLQTVRVVGIIVDPVTGSQAMIKAPNGQSFVVRKGSIVGRNDGEVIEITLQGIRIIEKFLDFMNRETRTETFLKSHPTAGK